MEGSVKLNTNGASKGNPGVAGIGGLLRSASGECIIGFAAHLGICTSVAAELYAIRIGLSIAWKYGYCNAVCEVDAQVVLHLLESGNASTHPLGVITDDIRILKARNWNLTFQYTFREGNFCADSLSKMGCDLDEDLAVFSSPPVEVAPSLAAIQGVFHSPEALLWFSA
ncbi:hypothetical protein F3Y22_tig00110840pilonHSYRG00107 [Hibiscus syriacus]|uniref:RNase H type-1 domain-containing protein n=1 Tax=Hibiscus syriacus TaxID=106335 RepID=A0A6A2ZM11_HIBSY|nr:hypothetical protein F3Y22_tig00110840pilonHSYRG00107 [Hibiscus syriacus]